MTDVETRRAWTRQYPIIVADPNPESFTPTMAQACGEAHSVQGHPS